MGSVIADYIADIQAVEDTLLRTGVIRLPEGGEGNLLRLFEQRAGELGWHPVTAQVGYHGDMCWGWVSIPKGVFRRGLGADLVLISDQSQRGGSGRFARAGDRKMTTGTAFVRFAFGSEGELVDQWIAAQDPRITKILIKKRGK